jgi:tRNA G46 methylase TrmB
MKTNPGGKIFSNQNSIHEDLYKIMMRHRETTFQKPIAQHTIRAVEYAQTAIARQHAPLILDSGCGTGESTIFLAETHPEHFVVGVDKSLARLSKNKFFGISHDKNFLLVRADLIDFWRLAVSKQWQVEKHYLLYPNPWPKKNQVKRRFHGHPVFFDLIKLGYYFELRSNWQIYVQEFAAAFAFATGIQTQVERFCPTVPYISLFEKKYAESGDELFRLIVEQDA